MFMTLPEKTKPATNRLFSKVRIELTDFMVTLTPRTKIWKKYYQDTSTQIHCIKAHLWIFVTIMLNLRYIKREKNRYDNLHSSGSKISFLNWLSKIINKRIELTREAFSMDLKFLIDKSNQFYLDGLAWFSEVMMKFYPLIWKVHPIVTNTHSQWSLVFPR